MKFILQYSLFNHFIQERTPGDVSLAPKSNVQAEQKYSSLKLKHVNVNNYIKIRNFNI